MTKIEFLDKLDYLLSDLPDEERMNAVWYYEDYFAEAGEAEEQAILRELGSPEVVAQGIRAACRERGSRETAGEYDSSFADAERRVYEEERRVQEEAYREAADAESSAEQQSRHAGYGSAYAEADTRSRGNRGIRLPFKILFLCFAYFPVILLIAMLLVLISFFLLLTFGLTGLTMLVAGVAAAGFGLGVGLQTGLGLLAVGGSLIVMAIGLILLVLSLNCGYRAISAIIRGVVKLIRRLTGRKEERREAIY